MTNQTQGGHRHAEPTTWGGWLATGAIALVVLAVLALAAIGATALMYGWPQ
jgi:hypothetical protein